MTRRTYLHRHTKTAPTGHAGIIPLRRLASVVIILTLGLGMATLAFANSLATQGRSQVEVQSEIDRLTSANATLQVEVAKLTSVTRIYNEALGLGLAAPNQAEAVGGANPVALRH